MLEAKGLTVRYGKTSVLDHVNFRAEAGQWLMIVGPNGAGKSTALKALSQTVPYTGTVDIDGANAKRMKPRDLARRIGMLAQSNHVGYAFTVCEVVRLGRYAYSRGILSGQQEGEDAHVESALAAVGLKEMTHQSVETLSGGELQRVFLAQVLAQNPTVLLLDEPTNHLDLLYQKQLFTLLQDWVMIKGRAILSVVHDLSLARAYGTHALLLNHGRAEAFGAVETALSDQNLNRVYGMDVPGWMRSQLGTWQCTQKSTSLLADDSASTRMPR